MYVRDSRRQDLRVRYADDTFFSPFTSLDSHLITSSIVVHLGCALREGAFFYIFMSRIFPPAFFLPHFSFFPLFFLERFSSFIVDEGGHRDLHNKYLYTSLSWP